MFQIDPKRFRRDTLRWDSFLWIGQERSQEDYIAQQLFAQMMSWDEEVCNAPVRSMQKHKVRN